MPAPPRASSPRFQYRALAGDVSDKLEGSVPCQQGQGVCKPASPRGTARGRGTAGPGAVVGLGEAKPQPSPLCTAMARGSRQPPQPSPGTPLRPWGAQRPPGCHGAPRRGAPHSSLPVLLTDPTSTRRHCGALDQCKPVRTSANQPLRTTALPNTQDRAGAWSNKASHGCAHIDMGVPTRTHRQKHTHRYTPLHAHTHVHADTCANTPEAVSHTHPQRSHPQLPWSPRSCLHIPPRSPLPPGHHTCACLYMRV